MLTLYAVVVLRSAWRKGGYAVDSQSTRECASDNERSVRYRPVEPTPARTKGRTHVIPDLLPTITAAAYNVAIGLLGTVIVLVVIGAWAWLLCDDQGPGL